MRRTTVRLAVLALTVISLTACLPKPAGYSTLIFDDQFTGRTLSAQWNSYITSRAANGAPWNGDGHGGSSTDPDQFNAAYFEPNHVIVNNGLTLTATEGSPRSGYNWTSGVVSTYGHFQFTGGYVEVRAKMPAGIGMWPGIWTLPGQSGTNGDDYEMDAFEGGFVDASPTTPNQNFTWHEENPGPTVGNTVNTGTDLTAGFHLYGMKWVPGSSITWYFDGKQVGAVTSAQTLIANEPMQLILSLFVADSQTTGWHTPVSPGPVSPSSEAMTVSEVSVWQ